ncbi:EpsG family protein [Providencia alcalifaciens]
MELSYYAAFIFVSFFLSLLSMELKSKEISIFSMIFTMYVLVILFGLRDTTSGTDTLTYKNWYDSLSNGIATRDFEYLFVQIANIVIFLGGSSSVFFSVICLLTLLFSFLSFKGSSNLLAASVALAVFPFFLPGSDMLANGIRNGLSIAIATFSCVSYLNGRSGWKSLILYVAISSLIHSSSIIFLSVLLVKKFAFFHKWKLIFLTYISFVLLDYFGIFESLFTLISSSGLSYHAVDRIIAFKYQDDDILTGYAKYYFLVITLIPYVLKKLKFNVSDIDLSFYYLILIPYAMIFSSPSSYRFSYIGYVFMLCILAKALQYCSFVSQSFIYIALTVIMVINYSTNTAMKFSVSIF